MFLLIPGTRPISGASNTYYNMGSSSAPRAAYLEHTGGPHTTPPSAMRFHSGTRHLPSRHPHHIGIPEIPGYFQAGPSRRSCAPGRHRIAIFPGARGPPVGPGRRLSSPYSPAGSRFGWRSVASGSAAKRRSSDCRSARGVTSRAAARATLNYRGTAERRNPRIAESPAYVGRLHCTRASSKRPGIPITGL